MGGQEREIQVSLDADKLKGYGISVPQAQQMILSSNLDFPTGNVQTREQSILVRLSGKYKTIEELRNLVLTSANGIQVRLGDVADVQDAQKEVEKISRVNQLNSIAIQIIKQSDANAVAVSEEVQKQIAQLEKDYASVALKGSGSRTTVPCSRSKPPTRWCMTC